MAAAQATTDSTPATQRRSADDVAAARKAGAEAADLVIRAQLNAGMNAEQIRDSAERVLADRFAEPSPASDAFYGAYDETVAACEAELAEPDIEAG